LAKGGMYAELYGLQFGVRDGQAEAPVYIN